MKQKFNILVAKIIEMKTISLSRILVIASLSSHLTRTENDEIEF
jgi:hypothetical protein